MDLLLHVDPQPSSGLRCFLRPLHQIQRDYLNHFLQTRLLEYFLPEEMGSSTFSP
jgi:hypothetical protein